MDILSAVAFGIAGCLVLGLCLLIRACLLRRSSRENKSLADHDNLHRFFLSNKILVPPLWDGNNISKTPPNASISKAVQPIHIKPEEQSSKVSFSIVETMECTNNYGISSSSPPTKINVNELSDSEISSCSTIQSNDIECHEQENKAENNGNKRELPPLPTQDNLDDNPHNNTKKGVYYV